MADAMTVTITIVVITITIILMIFTTWRGMNLPFLEQCKKEKKKKKLGKLSCVETGQNRRLAPENVSLVVDLCIKMA